MQPHSEPHTQRSALTAPAPAARTVEQTMAHYGWSRSYVFKHLQEESLEAKKAGRRTLVTAESANRHYASLPRQAYRAPKAA